MAELRCESTLRLAKVPGMSRLLKLPEWPANAEYGDRAKILPLSIFTPRR